MRTNALPLALLLGTCMTPPPASAEGVPAVSPATVPAAAGVAAAALPAVPEAEKVIGAMRSMVEADDVDQEDRVWGRHTLAISLRDLGHRDAALREAEDLQRLAAGQPPEQRAASQSLLAEALAAGGAYRRALAAAEQVDDADDRVHALEAIAEAVFYDGPTPPAGTLAVRDAVERRLTRELGEGKLGQQASASVRIYRWERAALSSGAAGPADNRAPAALADPAEQVIAQSLVADAVVFRLGRPVAAARPWLDAAAAGAAALPPGRKGGVAETAAQ